VAGLPGQGLQTMRNCHYFLIMFSLIRFFVAYLPLRADNDKK